MTKSNRLKKIYFDWLTKEYLFNDIDNNVVEISTPFLDNDFDHIIMYAEFLPNDRLVLTDDGWTIDKLKSRGVTFSGRTKSRNKSLFDILNNLGIHLTHDGELNITTDVDKFPLAKQRLLQAIIQVNDLVITHNKTVKSPLFEEVQEILKSREILYSERPSFAGMEGITVQFDFSVPTLKNEKLIRTIPDANNLNRAKLLAMDTRLLSGHKSNVEYVALIDDETHEFKRKNETKAIFSENSDSKIITLPKSEFISNPDILTNRA
ncbi:DUF1828 domain-containing protein [Streptococcus hyointestinalis]|nr:DUF1828 domain-containing protein [Streptococcus hyointestinalis]